MTEAFESSQKFIETHRTFTHTFIFPDRAITGIVIASEHQLDQDTDYIIGQLQHMGYPRGRTVFVEQGSPQQPDHFQSQIQTLVQSDPQLQEDHIQKVHFDQQSWYRIDFNGNPFAKAINYWISLGGKAKNIDLSGNLSAGAIEFLIGSTSIQFAMEEAYYQLTNEIFSFQDTMPLALSKLFPMVSKDQIQAECDQLYQVYSRLGKTGKRRSELIPIRDKLREQFMRKTLAGGMKQGDIVLAHPEHIQRIIEMDAR